MEDKEININFLYDEIIGYYDYDNIFVKPNLSDYNFYSFWDDYKYIKNRALVDFNITFPHHQKNDEDEKIVRFFENFFNHQNAKIIFDNTFNNINIVSYDQITEEGKYIYPIFFYTDDFHLKYKTIIIPCNILSLVKSGKCKIAFIQTMEGHFGKDLSIYRWFSDICEKYNFNRNNFIIIVSNLMAKDKHEELISSGVIKNNYDIYIFSYFTNNIFFSEVGPKKLEQKVKDFLTEEFNKSLQQNKIKVKEKHFLSFNRSSRVHRIVIATELLINEKLKNKHILSLMPSTNNPSFELDFNKIVLSELNDNYKFGKERILNFLENFNSLKGYKYDVDMMDSFSLTKYINREAHRNTFVNIVNETLYEQHTIFITEKTVKPITCGQPFIIMGNWNSLKKLKELGFKTFDKWWDESYDDEKDLTKK
jgi:hypothetical protein